MTKKIITFFLFLLPYYATILANPTEIEGFLHPEKYVFYNYLSISRNLSYEPMSEGYHNLVLYGGSTFTDNGHHYKLSETLPNGDEVFRSKTATASVYILSADRKKLAWHLIFGDTWYGSIFYTSSEAERDKFYRENKEKTLAGIPLDMPQSSSFGSISSGSSTTSNGISICIECGGTGINPHREEGTSYSGQSKWIGTYNQSGSKCSICGSYSSHFHSRCANCNVPR